jgi:tRNA wybutosine-synthesizing protein 3
MNHKAFIEGKKKALDSLEKASEEKKLDEEIISLLRKINDSPMYYTSSSCAGRIVILELPCIGDKKNAHFLGRWHRAITLQEFFHAVKKAKKGYLWLLAQSPILHIIADSSKDAEVLVKSAISCGFKNSGLRSIGKKNVVEICSTERLDAPIGKDQILFYHDKYINELVELVNNVLLRSKLKLLQFYNLLDNIL